MRQSTPPRGTRIFARVDRFVLECPSCALLLFGSESPRRGFMREGGRARARLRHGFRSSQAAFNPFSSRLRCPSCHTTFGIGLLVWPVKQAGKSRVAQPADQRASTAQWHAWAEHRAQMLSIVPEERKGFGDPMNVYLTPECICPDTNEGWTPACPVHRFR